MEHRDTDVARLLNLLEEVRLLLVSSSPPARVQKKKASWDDVWKNTPKAVRPANTPARLTEGRSRLSEEYTSAFRAIGTCLGLNQR